MTQSKLEARALNRESHPSPKATHFFRASDAITMHGSGVRASDHDAHRKLVKAVMTAPCALPALRAFDL